MFTRLVWFPRFWNLNNTRTGENEPMRENVGVKRAGHEMGRGMKILLGAETLDFSLVSWPQVLCFLTMGLKVG